MRRRDFTIGLALAAGLGTVRAQESVKQHRIAIVEPAVPVTDISETSSDLFTRRYYRAFFMELRRLGDIEGQNLTVERYSGGGRPEGFPDLGHRVVSSNPDVIVAVTNPLAAGVRAASGAIPIVWIGVEGVRFGLAGSLAHPGGNLTGVDLYDWEIWGKRLQMLKEVVPSAAKFGFLGMRSGWEGVSGQRLREMSRQLKISLVGMPLAVSTPVEYRRVFAALAQERPDGILVHEIGDLIPYRQLIVELIEKNRWPAIYGWRDYVVAGGLMAYGADLGEAWRRMADDVHQILNGAKPGDIPIYRPAKYDFVVNLKAAKAIGLTIPPALLARADEAIE
jgi:putative tryptophan/tyrosine transport system substrate-binding protein